MIKKLDHAAITVTDMEQALTFYRDKLGLKVVMDTEMGGEHFDMLFGCPGIRGRAVYFAEGLELLQFFSPADGKPLNQKFWDIGAALFVVEVDDLEATYSTLVDRGVEFYSPVVSPPTHIPTVGQIKLAHVRAPEGVRISLFEKPRP